MTRRRRERHSHRDRATAPAHPTDPAYLTHPAQFGRWAAAIFLLALALRLIHIVDLRSSPFFEVLLGDSKGYDEWARRIAAGDWIGNEVFYQAPLYPYFLAVVYSVAGQDLLVVRIIQAAIGAVASALVGLAAARLFGTRAGAIAGFGLALYAPAIFFDALLQKSVLDVFFVSVMLWLSARILTGRAEATSWLALGLAVGALSLTRENALVFIVVIVAWGLSGAWSAFARATLPSSAGERSLPRRSSAPSVDERRRGETSLGRVGAFALGLALVLFPVALRNYAVAGGLYLTTSQFGPNFYIGNHRGADGTYSSLRPGRGAPEYERQDATELAEQASQRRLTPGEVSSYWTDRALAHITSEPLAWTRLLVRKAALLVNTSEMLDTESQESHAEGSWILTLLSPVGHFGILVPLAAAGLITTWNERRRLWPLSLMLAAYAGSVVLLYVFARYRFPLVPFLLIFAAAGLTSARAWTRMRTPARLGLVATAMAVLIAIVNEPMLSTERMRAISETNLATGLHESGRMSEAVAHYESAIAIQPDYLPAYNNLGVTLRAAGRVDEAIRAYEKGLAIGEYPDLRFNLANAFIAAGRAQEAEAQLELALAVPGSASARTHNNLGTALAEQGRVDEAASEFRKAIALDPGSATAHRNLGNLLATHGQVEEGLRSLSIAVTLVPNDAEARYDYGSLLLEQQRFDPAAIELRKALELRPDHVAAMNNLGIALASQGRIADALTYFEQAVKLRPDFADAVRNRDQARQALSKQEIRR